MGIEPISSAWKDIDMLRYTVTARAYDNTAKLNAVYFGFGLISTGIVYYYFDFWWALPPGILAGLALYLSLYSKSLAYRLRKGTYPFPNPNNGAPDGDAKNYD